MSATNIGLRNKAKTLLQSLLPAALLKPLFGLWRQMYWWNHKRPRTGHNRHIAQKLLASGRELKLELGSGKRPGMEDWIASDLGGSGDIALDFTEPMPFPNNSIECIYSSHVLEHFSYPQPMLGFLSECQRILRPGGTFSLAVPDARIYIKAYNKPAEFDKQRFCDHDVGLALDTPIDYLNFIAYMGGEHKHLFDDKNLLTVLHSAGFRNVALREFDANVDLAIRHHESLYAIAYK